MKKTKVLLLLLVAIALAAVAGVAGAATVVGQGDPILMGESQQSYLPTTYRGSLFVDGADKTCMDNGAGGFTCDRNEPGSGGSLQVHGPVGADSITSRGSVDALRFQTSSAGIVTIPQGDQILKVRLPDRVLLSGSGTVILAVTQGPGPAVQNTSNPCASPCRNLITFRIRLTKPAPADTKVGWMLVDEAG